MFGASVDGSVMGHRGPDPTLRMGRWPRRTSSMWPSLPRLPIAIARGGRGYGYRHSCTRGISPWDGPAWKNLTGAEVARKLANRLRAALPRIKELLALLDRRAEDGADEAA